MIAPLRKCHRLAAVALAVVLLVVLAVGLAARPDPPVSTFPEPLRALGAEGANR